MNKSEAISSSENFEGLDSWNRLRTAEQLIGFIARREAEIASMNN